MNWEYSAESKVNTKYGLLGYVLSVLIFIPISVYKSQTSLPIDPYWRYQGILWASNIKSTGSIQRSPFSEHSYLLRWANDFVHNFTAPLIVTIISEVTGMTVQSVSNLPIFTFAIIFSTGIISKRITRNPKAFPLAILLGISFKFRMIQIVNTAHRGSLGWALFLTIIAFIIITESRDSKKRILGMSILLVPYSASVHTLPIASVIFFASFFAISRYYSGELLPASVLGVTLIVVTAYYTLLFPWLGQVVIKFISSLFIIEEPIGRIIDNTLLRTGSTSGNVSPLNTEYLKEETSNNVYYTYALWISFSSAVIICFLAVLIRIKERIQDWGTSSGISLIDVVFLSLILQGIADIIIQPLFASSGGIDPFILGFFVTPIFGSYSILKIENYLNLQSSETKQIAAVILLIVLLIPASFSYSYRPLDEGTQSQATKPEDRTTLEWNKQYISSEETIISDFDSLSKYYAIGGQSKTYLPRSGEPAFANSTDANHLINLYYRKPSQTGNRVGDVYIVSRSMKGNQIFHLGSIKTSPNKGLGPKLSNSSHWNKVHTAGSGTTYKTLNQSV